MRRNCINNRTGHKVRNIILSLAIMLLTLGVMGVETGFAQIFNPGTVTPAFPVNRVVYAAKFVCGFQPGYTPPQSRVLNGPGIYEYRDFEPGSYATALNVFYAGGTNRNTNINIFASVPETSQNAAINGISLGSRSISNFGTVKVDCEDVSQALNGPLPQVAAQETIEGFLYITRPSDDLTVEAVYTQSSQIGALGGEPLNLGGIGLGSSIHVQNIEPKTYSIRFNNLLENPFLERAP